MLFLLTFNKGNMVFHFEWGFPVKNLKHMNHLKTLTMVSMETKVVSRDSFLDKLSEKVYLRRVTGFLLGGTMCPPLVFGAQKKPGLDRVKERHTLLAILPFV